MDLFTDEVSWDRAIYLGRLVLTQLFKENAMHDHGAEKCLKVQGGSLLVILRFRRRLREIPQVPVQWSGPCTFPGKETWFCNRFCVLNMFLNGVLVSTMFWDRKYVFAGMGCGPWEDDLLTWTGVPLPDQPFIH